MNQGQSTKQISVSGIITGVERYYNGLLLTLNKGRRKIYIPIDLLEKKLNTKLVHSNDYERFINLAGCVISASGVSDSWYGGRYKSFIRANDFTLEKNNITEILMNSSEDERKNRIEKLLSTLFKGTKKSQIQNTINEIKEAKTASAIVVKPPKDLPFNICFTIYKLVSGKKLLPPGALPGVLEYFMNIAYEEDKKVSLKYSETNKYASYFFLQLPEDINSVKNLVKNKLYIIDTDNDFYFTSWKIYKTLRKVISYLYEITGKKEKDLTEIKKLIDTIITEGNLPIDNGSMLIELKTLPLTLIESILNEKKIIFITGQAGAGKTTFLKDFAEYLMTTGKKVHRCALAGGAASQVEGETIAYTTRHGIPPAVEYVLVDEAGMIDLITFSKLIDQIRWKKVILCGDPERQTPPPNGYEIIRNLVLPFLSNHCVIVAGEAYRYNKKTRIILIPVEMKTECIEPFLQAIISFIESKDLSWFITTLFHREDAGTINLNKLTKIILGKDPDKFEVGDRVIFKKNIKIGNRIIEGNKATAVIEKFHPDNKVTVRGLKSGRSIIVDTSDLALGYAFEVYNTQGKEADCVISFIPRYFPNSNGEFERKLEVALTRAKNLTFLFVSPNTLRYQSFTEQIFNVIKNRFSIKKATTIKEIRKILLETFGD